MEESHEGGEGENTSNPEREAAADPVTRILHLSPKQSLYMQHENPNPSKDRPLVTLHHNMQNSQFLLIDY